MPVTGGIAAAIQCVRVAFETKGYEVRKNGRFAVLGVEEALRVVRNAHSRSLTIEHLPAANDPSHAGISGYGVDDLAIASELSLLLGDDDVYPAVL